MRKFYSPAGPVRSFIGCREILFSRWTIKARLIPGTLRYSSGVGEEKSVRAAVHEAPRISMTAESSREGKLGCRVDCGPSQRIIGLGSNAENQRSADACCCSRYRRQVNDHSVVVRGKHHHRIYDLFAQCLTGEYAPGSRALIVKACTSCLCAGRTVPAVLRKHADSENAIRAQGIQRVRGVESGTRATAWSFEVCVA